jgi:hypothetical protein
LLETACSARVEKRMFETKRKEVPTYEEINKIIKNLKSNKAAGPDDILPEFI